MAAQGENMWNLFLELLGSLLSNKGQHERELIHSQNLSVEERNYAHYAAAERWLNEESVKHELGRVSILNDRAAAIVAAVAAVSTGLLPFTITDQLVIAIRKLPIPVFWAFLGLVLTTTLLLVTSFVFAMMALRSKEMKGLPKGSNVYKDLVDQKLSSDGKATADRTVAHYLQIMRDSHSEDLDRRFKHCKHANSAVRWAMLGVALLALTNVGIRISTVGIEMTDNGSDQAGAPAESAPAPTNDGGVGAATTGGGTSGGGTATPGGPEPVVSVSTSPQKINLSQDPPAPNLPSTGQGPQPVTPVTTQPQTINQGDDGSNIQTKDSSGGG